MLKAVSIKALTLPFFVVLVFFLVSCKENETINTLSVSRTIVSIGPAGGSTEFTIRTDAGSWLITNPATEWVELSEVQGNQNFATISITVSGRTLTPRSATLTITAGTAKPMELVITQAASDHLYGLSGDVTKLTFNKSGGTNPIRITTDAPSWSLTNDAEWLQLSSTTGGAGISDVTVTATLNNSSESRTATITLSGENAPSIDIQVTQKGDLYPDYNTSPQDPDPTGMQSDATQLASKIVLGWNLGNSLEAIGGETNWGNPKVTKTFIEKVKASGFNAIRLPCSWNQYMESAATAKLNPAWLNRVKEVVQYCVDVDMYVVLNIHWDGGWLENNCTPEKQEENNAKQKAFWQQIATHLRDFDERLIFAGTNEPNVDNATQNTVLQSYHQTFINAVRGTGGRNSYRILVVQGPSTDIDKTHELMAAMPTDELPGRLMAEVHFYSPYNFTLMTADADWGKQFYYWGNGYHSTTDPTRNPTWGEEEYVDAQFLKMKTQFVDKGIPVVLGEYSPLRRDALTGDALTLHLASRAYYLKYVTRKAKENGMLPFYWDNGALGNNGSGIFNRNANTVFDQQAMDALIEGAQ
jgi:endoglucanase